MSLDEVRARPQIGIGVGLGLEHFLSIDPGIELGRVRVRVSQQIAIGITGR